MGVSWGFRGVLALLECFYLEAKKIHRGLQRRRTLRTLKALIFFPVFELEELKMIPRKSSGLEVGFGSCFQVLLYCTVHGLIERYTVLGELASLVLGRPTVTRGAIAYYPVARPQRFLPRRLLGLRSSNYCSCSPWQ